MLKAKKFKIIIGGKDNRDNQLVFIEAFATKTRMMGVIALKLLWRDTSNQHYLAQWFTLDAEEHGIYDHVNIHTKSMRETDKYTQQFMGSLGGEKVSITEREAVYLINHYVRMNIIHNKDITREEEFKFLITDDVALSEEELNILNSKIYEEIESPVQLLNLFLMRLVAKDQEAMSRYVNSEAMQYISALNLVDKAASLLKNKSNLIDRVDSSFVYAVEALVDHQADYFIAKLELEVSSKEKEYIVTKIIFLDKEYLEPEEVAEEITVPEYIKVFKILGDEEGFVSALERVKSNALQYQFLQGLMLVEFRKNNDHVKKQLYHIGGDIRAIYFINSFKEFIVCYYQEEDYSAIYNSVLAYLDIRLDEVNSYRLEGSVIYQYAEMQKQEFTSYVTEILSYENSDKIT